MEIFEKIILQQKLISTYFLMAFFTKQFKLTILFLINILAFEKKLKFRLSQIVNSLNFFILKLVYVLRC